MDIKMNEGKRWRNGLDRVRRWETLLPSACRAAACSYKQAEDQYLVSMTKPFEPFDS
jgi:hypothetical protein